MPPAEVMVWFRGTAGKLEGEEERCRWPLAMLVAYLFNGRECDEVRALLAVGEVSHRDLRMTWEPVSVTVEEFSTIERTFPQADASRSLVMEEVSRVELVVPAEQPVSWVSLDRAQALVRHALNRARYGRFDYGFWGDLYVSAVSPEEATVLLRHAALRGTYAGGATLARRLGSEPPHFLSVAPSRRGCLMLPFDAWRSARWWRNAERWYRSALGKGAAELGAGVRFIVPRPNTPVPWNLSSMARS